MEPKTPAIIIPAYQPSDALLTLVHELNAMNPSQLLIIVNDGSAKSCDAIFHRLQNYKNVIVLHHAVNLGKGQALKTAFNYFLLHSDPNSPGVITADADGQHTASDILTLSEHLTQDPSTLWIGSRKLNAHVPFRSRFGNALTRKIFHVLTRQPVHDTQSGLRGIPRHALPGLLRLSSPRYEYELDMLIRAIEDNIPIREIPIETIYIDGNKSSHFNPIRDSIKVYFVFLRYLTGSIASACVDFALFALFSLLTHWIFFSLAIARLLSGTLNFVLCKKTIFKSGANFSIEALKYTLLAVFSLCLSYILILGFVKDYGMNLYVSKIIADACVFVINFTIQKVLVFPSNTVKE